MITLLIDGIECKVHEDNLQLPLFQASKLRSVAAWRQGERVELSIEATAEMARLFGFAEELYRDGDFNSTYHCAELYIDGVPVFEGVASLVGAERGDKTQYHVVLRSGGDNWADEAALTRLNATKLDAQRQMTLGSIYESWSDDGVVRMLPLCRDSYPEAEATGLLIPQRMLLPQDYHPFLSVKAIVESLVESSGYTLCSNFFDSPMASRLMLSGAYRGIESSEAYATMGFKALRTTSHTAVASQIGRVDAWGPVGGSYVGFLVDTVDSTAVDEEGNTCSEAYSAGGCFRFEDGRPIFYPKREIRVAFDVHLRYTTDYRIISSKHLAGFDRIYLGNECRVNVDLANRFIDKRDSVSADILYKLFIFDYDAESSYRLEGVGDITEAVSMVEFQSDFSGSTRLYVKPKDATAYIPYEGDWALYEGYVNAEGRRTVEVTIRTPYEVVTPTSPKVFNLIFFSGAEQGQQLTLHAGCSVTPIFGGTAGYGEFVEFKDVANHDISQAELLEAIAHMFNLRIYSHRPSRRLFIEPYDDFYGGEVVDWREYQIDDEAVIEECAAESFMATTLGYQPSDGATNRIAAEYDGEFGQWSSSHVNYAAKQSVDNRINQLFSATATMAGLIGAAPSAEVMVAGDRDVIDTDDYVAPRIALYYGLVPLPSDERWPIPIECDGYPLVAFHCPSRGESLCFEDRDGCGGLHRHYDNDLVEQCSRQYVTLNISLSAARYVALFDPDASGGNIRSRFRLRVGGNSSLFRLEEIVSYDAVKGLARCSFRRLISD